MRAIDLAKSVGTRQRQYQREMFFTYSARVAAANGLAIAAGGTARENIEIDSASDFLVTQMNIQAVVGADNEGSDLGTPFAWETDGTGANDYPHQSHVSFEIRQNSEAWSQGVQIPISLMGGDGRHPFYLSSPRLLYGNETVYVDVTNNASGWTCFVDILLIGSKLFT